MKEKLNSKTVSMALAGVAGIFYIACAALFAVAPQTAMKYFSYMFHGIDITKIAVSDISFAATLAGFIEIELISLIAGYLFVKIYNYLSAKVK